MPEDIQARLRDVPHKPGVYVMRDRLKRVIYVGKRAICESGSRTTLHPRAR